MLRSPPGRTAPWLIAITFITCTASLLAQEKIPAARTPMQKRIETALAKKLTWNFEEQEFSAIIAAVAKEAGVPISFDLRDAPVTKDAMISAQFGKMSLGGGLRILLRPHDLGFVESKLGIRITSKERAEETAVVRVYPVADLVRNKDAFDDPWYDFETLINLITIHVNEDSWSDSGGHGGITSLSNALVVSHTPAMQREVEKVLAALRKIKADQAKLKLGEFGSTIALADLSVVNNGLSKPYTGEFKCEIREFVKQISTVTGVAVVVDPTALEEAGVTSNEVISGKYENIAVKELFEVVLEPFSLCAVPSEEAIIITSQHSAPEQLETRFYPIPDLAKWYMPRFGMGVPTEGPHDVESICMSLEQNVNEDTWASSGGSGQITAFGNPTTLVVSQTAEMHERIEEALHGMRAAGAAKVFAEDMDEDRIIQQVYPLYAARRTKREEGKPVVGGVFTGPGHFDVVKPIPDAQEVAELIRELIPDKSWEDKEVLLKPFHDVLIVKQRPAMIRKIEKLLQDIDAWHTGQYIMP